jgi:hypothetical protein
MKLRSVRPPSSRYATAEIVPARAGRNASSSLIPLALRSAKPTMQESASYGFWLMATPPSGRENGVASQLQQSFSEKRKSCYASFVALRPIRLADGPGRGFWDEDRRKKFGAKRKGPWRPCKPLISHKTAKGFFGNAWRKRPQIWKSLA